MPSSGRRRTGSWPSRRETRKTGTAVRRERQSRREKGVQRCQTYSTVPVRRTRLRFRPAVTVSLPFPSSTESPRSDLVLSAGLCPVRIGGQQLRAGLGPSPSIRALSLEMLGLCGRFPPSPLPVLLPLEKGRGGEGCCSALRIAPLPSGAGILAPATAEPTGPSLSLRGADPREVIPGRGRTRGRDNRGARLVRQRGPRRHAILHRSPTRRGRSRGSGCRSSARSGCGGQRARRRGGAGRG